MSQTPVALQLWSVREETARDFAATVQAVARMGYAGVETAGFGNLTSADAARAIADAGLQCAGMHVGIKTLRGDIDQVINDALAFGTKNIICPSWPRQQYLSGAACQQIGEELNRIGAHLRRFGLRFHFHNHDAELAIVDGRRVLDWILDAAEPRNLGCEADVYWLHKGGKAPAEFIREQGRRITLVHLKDEKEIGLGPVDFPPVFEALDAIGAVEWHVVEVEHYNHPPLESVQRSLEQLRAWGRA
ncbi:MAG: sugar phosphate isomerase/epimerase [Verrucomicrobia bacterium]|nr:MAG: sugar phosphate isomerase/epimerase [Verrucomicrobiota bacterium]